MGIRVYDCCTFLQVTSCTTKDSTFYFRLALERYDLNMSWNYCFCSERLETRLGIASQRDGAWLGQGCKDLDFRLDLVLLQNYETWLGHKCKYLDLRPDMGKKTRDLSRTWGKKKKTCDHPWYPIGRIVPFQCDWQSRPAGKNKNKFHLPCDDPATWNSPAVTFGERRDFRINNTVKSRLVHHSAELTLWKRWLYPQVHQVQPW